MSNHKVEEIGGKLKQAVADITGDDALGREGKIDEASAAIKRQIDKGSDGLKKVLKTIPKSDEPTAE